MESANESARRAVNAILRHHSAVSGTTDYRFCRIWNPEDYEVDDFDDAKEIDRRLFERGEPHSMDNEMTAVFLEMMPWDLLRLGIGRRRNGG